MADKEIRQLNEDTSINNSDLFVMQDAATNETKKVAASNLPATTSEKLDATIAFHAYRNAAQTITSSLSTVVYDTERYDYGSDYNTTTGKFTAPLAGVYRFSTGVALPTNTTRIVIVFVFSVIGSIIVFDTTATDHNKANGNIEIGLALGETCEVQLLTTTNNDVADTETWFAGSFVGA